MTAAKELLTGIAVVIDDAVDLTHVEESETTELDRIGQIVRWFEEKWHLSFVKSASMPDSMVWPNLLTSASFVLLDWKLWEDSVGATEVQRHIDQIVEFLRLAMERLVPVFIFTNENPDDVIYQLPDDICDEADEGISFPLVKRKQDLWQDGSFDTASLDAWIHENASIYALKVWNREMDSARNELFSVMYQRSVDWPRVFWNNYESDNADPSASLTSLIGDSLAGRVRTDAFKDDHLGGNPTDVPEDELRMLIGEMSFRQRDRLSKNEVRNGDVFEVQGKNEYWLNLRPDCDCIPRDGSCVDEVDIYCVRGKRLSPSELRKRFKNGHFEETVSQSVVFGILEGGRSILFNFANFRVLKYGDVKKSRIGRLLHPYITRVQQRYGLFIQRVALPRIPDLALGNQGSADRTAGTN